MIIRAGTSADIPTLIEVELSAGALFEGTHMVWAIGQTTPAARFEGAIAGENLWVAVDGGSTVAFLIADVLDDDFYIDEISVAQSHQRRGLGRLLIETAVAEARKRGHAAATLTTDRSLPWNAPYYARLGFTELTPAETTPELAARLASHPSPERRCAMWKALVQHR